MSDWGGGGPSGVVTPEGVQLHLNRAGPATRILARGLDAVIQFVVLVVFAVAVAFASNGIGATPALIAYLFAVPLVIFGYPAIAETVWHGRTVGKVALGLRVVTREGSPVRFRHALVRSVLFIVDGLILGPTIGVLMLVLSRDTVRLGDLAAGTIVIRERTGARMPAPVAFRPPNGLEDFAARLDVSRIGPADYELARAVILRGPDLTPSARHHVGGQVAGPLARKAGLPGPPPMHPEAFLLCLVSAYQLRNPPAHSPSPPGYPAPASPPGYPAPASPPGYPGYPAPPPPDPSTVAGPESPDAFRPPV